MFLLGADDKNQADKKNVARTIYCWFFRHLFNGSYDSLLATQWERGMCVALCVMSCTAKQLYGWKCVLCTGTGRAGDGGAQKASQEFNVIQSGRNDGAKEESVDAVERAPKKKTSARASTNYKRIPISFRLWWKICLNRGSFVRELCARRKCQSKQRRTRASHKLNG